MRRHASWPAGLLILVAAASIHGQTPTAVDSKSAPSAPDLEKPTGADAKAAYETVSIRGRIVWFGEATKQQLGIDVDADALKSTVALQTAEGRLIPIIKELRGRGFHIDPKLRDFEWELLVRRYPQSPAVQIVRTYVWRDGKKFEFDYWCDICAIPMYELKDCECCQGPIRFRLRETSEK